MLDLARRESGSYLDPQVPNPNGSGTLVPAQGIAVATNDPVKRPAVSKLPLPQRGAPAQRGVRDPRHPPRALPLPPGRGGGRGGLQGPARRRRGHHGVVTVVDYGTQPWPNLSPLRLEVRA